VIGKLIAISDDKRRLLGNFFSLSVLQGANYLLPLITLPYLVRVLGPEKFGLVAFAQAFIQYFVILTDYGFNLSATREISIHRENKQKVSEIFCSVLIIKFVLMVLGLILLCAIVFSFSKFKSDWQIYFLTFGMVIGQVLFPVWLFQGMERMKFIALLNIASKLLFTISIFVVVREASDYVYVPLLNSLGFITAGTMGLWVAVRYFKVKAKGPPFIEIKREFKNGWHIFISTVAVSFYRILPSFFIGVFHSYEMVAYYAVGEKLIRAILGLLQPVSQTLFPFMSRKFDKSLHSGMKSAKNVLKYLSIFTFFLFLFIFVFAPNIICLFAGETYTRSTTVLLILSPLPFVVGIANIFGVQIMLNVGLEKAFSRILTFGGGLALVLAVVLIPPYPLIGAGLCVLIAEVTVMLGMVLKVVIAIPEMSVVKTNTN